MVAKTVPLPGQDQKVEALFCLYQSIGHPVSVSRVHVIVHIAGNQQEISAQIFCQLRVFFYVVNEFCFSIIVNFFFTP